jgi:hypothetical protein
MSPEFGGMQVHNGTSNVHLLSTGTELTAAAGMAWAAISADDHGPSSVTPNLTTGRLTLTPGTYRIDVDISCENQAVSGLSSEDVTVQDIVAFYLAKGAVNFPSEITGTRMEGSVLEGLRASMHITAIIEITKTDLDNSYNYISLWGATEITGGTASDILIHQARFLAQRIG